MVSAVSVIGVSSRDYILKRVLYGNRFTNPPKKQQLGGKVSAKLHFKYGWTCKSTETRAEMKTYKKTTLLQDNDGIERQEDYLISAVYAADVE